MEKINLIKTYWYSLSEKLRFLFVGGLNAGISYLLYSIFVLSLGAAFYQTALALAWLISSVTSFFTQRYFVFNVKGNLVKQYFKCCTTWVISYMINAGILEVFVKNLRLNVYLAQIAATFTAAVFTYILFKKFAFKQK